MNAIQRTRANKSAKMFHEWACTKGAAYERKQMIENFGTEKIKEIDERNDKHANDIMIETEGDMICTRQSCLWGCKPNEMKNGRCPECGAKMESLF